ncbi:hypothetical protein [Zoogloea sp.]|uniref:hypothetical protein n=1 Tax=Zoogloea sp. TaxID=49181 RepID=UPI002CA7DEA0|nr:hypothetical protein [Zoogloea sp.]HPI59372.1 hypothetical protein [Zoogloea sp.]
MPRPYACLFAILLAITQPVLAQGRLEIITLRHRSADQIVPALRPLVEPGGALSTLDDKLLIRVSPANLVELQAAISALDVPLRRLLVSVRQSQQDEGQGGEISLSGRVAPGNSRILIEGGAGRQARTEGINQQVQVVEGGRALIRVGQSLPVPMREWRSTGAGWQALDSVRYTDVGSGFLAAPQLLGEQVSIEIAPAMERVGPNGVIESTRLATTVSGRVGQWIPLGSSQSDTRRFGYGTSGIQQGNTRSQALVWLRVDVLD